MKRREMNRLAEMHLYLYRDHKREIQAYIDSCTDIHFGMGEAVSHSSISDPAARGGLKLADKPRRIKTLEGWVWSVETAWAELRTFNPEEAEIMERYYKLTVPTKGDETLKARKAGRTARRIEIQNDLYLSDRTFYSRRDDIIESVVHAAIQCGALVPYEKGQGGRG